MTKPKTTRSGLLPTAGMVLAFSGMLLISAVGPAQSQPGQNPPEVSAPVVAETGSPSLATGGAGEPSSQQADGNSFSRAYPMPILLAIIIGTTTLVATLVNVIVTPWTMRRIAADQRAVADKAANAAVSNAAAANENAKAAGKSAEAAVLNATAASRNSVNTGIHLVARLRQEWINDLRNELAALHSLLSNFQPPATDIDPAAAAALQEAHDTRVRDANMRLARVEMLLNPREFESRRLVAVLRFLAGEEMELKLRHRRARWIVRWGQVVLKTEWDRVRSELNGTPVASPHRRVRSLKVQSALPFKARAKDDTRGASSSTAGPKKARPRGKAPVSRN